MSTLRQPLAHLDYIMDKYDSKKLFMVLHTQLHSVWVIKDGGGEAPFEMPVHQINRSFMKVDPKVARILYAEADASDKPTDTPTTDDQPSE